jgi:tetratricopeptide (TPR) repeat protein
MDKLATLRSMVEQDPRNSFARYGLAMEHVSRAEYDLAMQEFEALLASNPDYVPAYYHAGRALEKLDRVDDARTMYESGITAARRKGDQHTLSELQAALDMAGLT